MVQTYQQDTRLAAGEGVEMGMHETWIVQEWCDRGTLAQFCRTPRTDERFWPEVLEINQEIAAAGSYIHSFGIIHGDLSANNVLIKSHLSRKGYVCKMCDFGLARILEGESTEIVTTQLGTVTHMPPELLSLEETQSKLTAKADIYAAGIFIWQSFMGKTPYEGLSAPKVILKVASGARLELPPEIPKTIVRMFERCTASSPEARPEFEELIRFYLEETPSTRSPQPLS